MSQARARTGHKRVNRRWDPRPSVQSEFLLSQFVSAPEFVRDDMADPFRKILDRRHWCEFSCAFVLRALTLRGEGVVIWTLQGILRKGCYRNLATFTTELIRVRSDVTDSDRTDVSTGRDLTTTYLSKKVADKATDHSYT